MNKNQYANYYMGQNIMNPYQDYYENSNNQDFFTPNEGFLKGNMFKDLYDPYKNYQPASLTATTEEEQLLLQIQEICFAAHEMNLYLDLHPEDSSVLMLFRDYCKKERELVDQYENMYGPLIVSAAKDNNYFPWVNSYWPWEGQANV